MKFRSLSEKSLERSPRRTAAKFVVFLIAVLAVTLFVRGDARFYDRTVGKVTSVTNVFVNTRTGTDGTRKFREKYYDQRIRAVVKNGPEKGRTVTLKNRYGASQVYDTKYKKGDYLFIDNIEPSGRGLMGSPAGVKRDWVIALVTSILFGLFLLIGGREGLLTIASLTLNLIAFYFALRAYLGGTNILFLMIPVTILFTALLLFFLYGTNEKTMLAFAATTVTTLAVTLIVWILTRFGTIDYDFMDYLNQPYDPDDACLIYLSEVLIGCLGAVMDVVITIVVTCDEITRTESGTKLSRRELARSCRSVGDDLVGTMISLMLFTNLASCIPAFLLYLRNGVAFPTIMRYNMFFDVSRFLTGSIAVVLAIPAASFLSIRYYTKKRGRKEAAS